MALKLGDGRVVTSAALLTGAGVISGSAFPKETTVRFNGAPENVTLVLTYPDNTTEDIKHEMIKCATILCAGDFVVGNPMQPQTCQTYAGVKYLVVLKDGRQYIHLVHLAETQYLVERIYF